MTLAERRYQSYTRAYKAKEAELAKYGARMSSPMMTPGEYNDYYPLAARDYAKSKNIPKIVAEKQAREYSPAQARVRARIIREQGVQIERGYAKFKYGVGVNKDLDQAIENRYAELRDTGKYTTRQMKEMIGIEFFYSDDDEVEEE